MNFLRKALRNWRERHQHPFNFAIHLLGIPLAVIGLFLLFFLPWYWGAVAFILGLYPLVVAVGASQLARRDVGTPVFGGMILASFIGIFAIPPLYVAFQAIRERLRIAISPHRSTAFAFSI